MAIAAMAYDTVGMASERVPPYVPFAVSAVFHSLGPSFAVLLFARVDVLGVAWLRIASAALIFAVWRRPWRSFAQLDDRGRQLPLSWGAVLAVMNCCFSLAIDRLPLGTVAAIEFLPVVGLAALGARTPRNALALAAAVPGVLLLTGVKAGGHRRAGRGDAAGARPHHPHRRRAGAPGDRRPGGAAGRRGRRDLLVGHPLRRRS